MEDQGLNQCNTHLIGYIFSFTGEDCRARQRDAPVQRRGAGRHHVEAEERGQEQTRVHLLTLPRGRPYQQAPQGRLFDLVVSLSDLLE